MHVVYCANGDSQKASTSSCKADIDMGRKQYQPKQLTKCHVIFEIDGIDGINQFLLKIRAF